MKRKHHRRPKKTGARFFQSLASVLLLLVAFAGGLFLSARFLPRPFEGASIGNSTRETPTSLARALGALDASKVQELWNAYANPGALDTSIQTGEGLRIEVQTLARQHPAWLLANALESAGVSPRAGRDIEVVQRAKNPLLSQLPAAGEGIFEREANAQTLQSGRGNEGAVRAQSQAIADFARDFTERQAEIRRTEENLRARELEDTIRDGLRRGVESVALGGVDAQTALELSNLRLLLLQNLAVAPAEREAARQEIERIEKRLAVIWREQTRQQTALLEEAFQNAPTRQRREGLERIRAAMQILESEDRSERERILAELRTLAARDMEAARRASLQLVLPSSRRLKVFLDNFLEPDNANLTSGGANLRGNADLSVLPSGSAQALAQTGTAAPAQIAALRQKARDDARQWAAQIAAQLGGRLSDAPGARDVTPLAQKLLWPTD